METSSSNKILLVGLLGFVAGVLMAPDKGSVTRDRLKHKADELTDKAKNRSEKAKKKVHEMRNKARQRTDKNNIDGQVEQLVP